MTKTDNNRVRAKARKSPKSLRDLNTAKMNAAMRDFVPAHYILVVEFSLTNNQDMNDPIEWLDSDEGRCYHSISSADLDVMDAGSGYNFNTGFRDFGFGGQQYDMESIMRAFAASPFKVASMSVYPDNDYFSDYNDNKQKAMMDAMIRKEGRAKKAKKAKGAKR